MMSDDGFIRAVLTGHRPVSRVLNEDQVTTVIQWWAKQLCLEHWVIDWKFVRGYDAGGRQGELTFTLSKHRATIRLLDPNDCDPACDPVDYEQTIVHELLHAQFAAWHEWARTDSKMAMGEVDTAVCEEQPIERLSWVLVTMRRAMPQAKFSWEEEAC